MEEASDKHNLGADEQKELAENLYIDQCDLTRIIIGAMTKAAMSHVTSCEENNPFDLWRTLERDYEGVGSTSILADLERLHQYRMGTSTTLTKACADFEEIFRRLKSKGEIQSDNAKCAYLLAALGPDYNNIKGAVYASGQDLVWKDLISKLHAGRGLGLPQSRFRVKAGGQGDAVYQISSQRPKMKPGKAKSKVGHNSQPSTVRCWICDGPHMSTICPHKCPRCPGVNNHREKDCRKSGQGRGSTSRRLAGRGGSSPSTPAWINYEYFSKTENLTVKVMATLRPLNLMYAVSTHS